ncbi:MAG: hypothetical protein JWQ81_3718 [Amycolatopsis sp.]|uniref:alcohol dehydrogenase catalytic domain-containing protein n=1 Tax=Amycolatopsis sp. TaxID=37632 RepID=UPI00261AFABC|nr:hypothetical protein [Amycolatopsis sp.]MCU1682979.1 hypothetical protein [Amycolatopsis sp.]
MTPAGAVAPFVLGFDRAGTVTAVGKGVEPELVGTHVLGFSQWFVTGHGTQASLVALPCENIAVAGGRFTSAELTTFGLNGLTALFFAEAAGQEEQRRRS